MVDDPRVIWNMIGEPPESPWAYAARTGVSEDEIPHSIKQAWRTWNTKEQALVEKAAESMSGQSTDEILKSLGYADEADRGKSMFARYRSGEKANVLENVASDAFKKAVHSGHMTWDPARGMYINPGTGTWENPDQMWDEKGRISKGKATGWGNMLTGNAPPPMMNNNSGMQPQQNNGMMFSSFMGPQRGDSGFRPNLRSDINNKNFGQWGAHYGKQQLRGSGAKKDPSNTFQYQGMGNPGY